MSTTPWDSYGRDITNVVVGDVGGTAASVEEVVACGRRRGGRRTRSTRTRLVSCSEKQGRERELSAETVAGAGRVRAIRHGLPAMSFVRAVGMYLYGHRIHR